jgi:two-component system response regulator AtoC
VRLAPALLDHLARADWPGNVRELENTLARLVALSDGRELGLGALSGAVPRAAPPAIDEAAEEGARAPGDRLTLREQVEAYERGIIAHTLRACGGNQSEAARRLGTSRVTLIDKIHRYKLG